MIEIGISLRSSFSWFWESLGCVRLVISELLREQWFDACSGRVFMVPLLLNSICKLLLSAASTWPTMVSQRRWRWPPWLQSLAILIVFFGLIWRRAWPFYSRSAKAGEVFSTYASKSHDSGSRLAYRLPIQNPSPMEHLQLFASRHDHSHWSCCYYLRMQGACRHFCSIHGHWSDLRQDDWYHG